MSEPRRFPRREPAAARWVPDDAVLTQYGREMTDQDTFRSSPRFPDEHDLSLLWGAMSPGEAAYAVRGRMGDSSDRVRNCTAGALRAAGFTVSNTPTRRNPDHVFVQIPREQTKWDHDEEMAFEHVMRDGGS